MSMSASMNRYETCIYCGGPVLNGLPCPCQAAGPLPFDPWLRLDIDQGPVPVPRDREMAKRMIEAGRRYLEAHPENPTLS